VPPTQGKNPIRFCRILTFLFVTLMFTSAAWALEPEKVLVSFNGSAGNMPSGLSMDAAGNLWGVTSEGGTGQCGNPSVGCGIVFELIPTTGGRWDSKTIYNFQGGRDGAGPSGNLAFDAAGNVYGVTGSGGTGCNCGTVYELTPDGDRYQHGVIYRFNNTKGHMDGETPYGGLVMNAGNLYGTTISGGNFCTSGCGTIFELSPSGGSWTETLIYPFKGGSGDGATPYSPLVFDAQGNFYGTTYNAGAGFGAVYEFSPVAGGYWFQTILYVFQGRHDGGSPIAGVVLDAAGNLYGTTTAGGNANCGTAGCGTVFELSPTSGGAWTETTIHAFSSYEGQVPGGGVIFDAAGNLYGVAALGGAYSWGVAYELTPGTGGSWTESDLHNFGNGTDGKHPGLSLAFDSAGNLYGVTGFGGTYVSGSCPNSNGCGTVFQLTP
jgi:uncharacterized repeat protein (TIGR03803 family)